MNKKLISIVIPCFNEKESLPELFRRLESLALKMDGYRFEFLLVNDGGEDGSSLILKKKAAEDFRYKVVYLAKNFGHQIAISAGLDFCEGDFTVILDADLQDPPELVVEMVEKLESGFDVVHTRRNLRNGESTLKKSAAKIFYSILKKLSSSQIVKDSGDFRAISRQVVMVIRRFRDHHKFLRGTFANIGFRQCVLSYDRSPRYDGVSKYSWGKMLSLSLNAFLNFSFSPLRLVLYMSMFLWSCMILYMGKGLYEIFILSESSTVWAALVSLIFFCSSLILFSIWIIGTYIIRIFKQGQGHPVYWTMDFDNIPSALFESREPSTFTVQEASRDIHSPVFP